MRSTPARTMVSLIQRAVTPSEAVEAGLDRTSSARSGQTASGRPPLPFGARGGFQLWMYGQAISTCLRLGRRSCDAGASDSHCDAQLFEEPPVFGENSLLRFLWEASRGQHGAQPCTAPDAFYLACMNKVAASVGQDRFTKPDKVLSLAEQDAQTLSAGQSGTLMLDNGLSLSTFDPSSTRLATAKYARLIETLRPGNYDANFVCGRRDQYIDVFMGTLTARQYMQNYRSFVSAKDPDTQEGYGVRLAPHLCEWVPKMCADGVKRPVVDLGDDRNGWRAPGSDLEQPPWNSWPEELTDQLLSDFMFSLQGMLVQSVAGFRNVSWEVELAPASRACAEAHAGAYALPTAWLARAPVRERFLRYGVDVFFDQGRRLAAMYDGTAEPGAPACWSVSAGLAGEVAAKKWMELKLLGMAAVLALQPYMFHAVEKIAVGGVMWTAIYNLPVGHPIRAIMLPFGHRSLEKANQIYATTLESGDAFRMQTAFTEEGWRMVTERSLELAMRFAYPTGTSGYWEARGLSGSKMPYITFGSAIREKQFEFVKKALRAWNVPPNPLEDVATQSLAEQVRKQWGFSDAQMPLNTHDDMAWFLSELLYRMSVTHTNTHHHPICHATMANGKVFPMQLVRGSRGDVFPTSDHHVATMVLWDMGTEPMPHMDFPLASSGAFRESGKASQEQATRQVEAAYLEYQEQLVQIEQQVHDYNRNRCQSGDYAASTGCLPYSCVMPREMLMSYGI